LKQIFNIVYKSFNHLDGHTVNAPASSVASLTVWI